MKRRLLGACLLVSLCGMASAQQSTAQAIPTAQVVVPRLIRFSGQLPGATGTVGITFTLHKGQQDNAALWIETQNVQLDSTGKYTVLLGVTKPEGIPTDLFSSGEAQWLGVQVQGKTEQPRVLLVSVPYALRAAEADTLAGHAPAEFVTTDKLSSAVQQELQSSSSTNSTPVHKNSANKNSVPVDGATNFTDSTTNQVVLVTQNGTGAGLVANAGNNFALSGTSTNTAIYGSSNGATHATAAALEGVTTASQGRGIFGWANTTSGTNFGLYGQANSTSGTGIAAASTATSGTTVGLEAQDNSPAGTAAVIQARGGGKIISGQSGSSNTEKFAVDGAGDVSTTGYVNIGATSPSTYPLSATSSIAAYTASLTNSYSTGWGVYASAPYVGIGAYADSYGVFGEAEGTNGYGVEGYAGSGIGVFGEAASSGYSAGYFWNSTGAGTSGTAVEGFSGSGSASDRPGSYYDPAAQFSGPNGIIATASGDSDDGDAVMGFNLLSGGRGVLGYNESTGTNGIGVFGFDGGPGGGTSFAGYFLGDVHITGSTTSPTASATVIDHPLDPANKSLQFASMQSPEQLNVFNGNVTLDGSGHATVTLPAYFEQVSKDFRYQLTCIGGYAPVYIAHEVQNNSFQIAGGTPGMKVSWSVSAVRNDKYAQAHPFVSEKEKPAASKGKFYSPELYGASAEQGMVKTVKQTDRVSPAATAPRMPSRPTPVRPVANQASK